MGWQAGGRPHSHYTNLTLISSMSLPQTIPERAPEKPESVLKARVIEIVEPRKHIMGDIHLGEKPK